ncbi:MAG: glutathione S-transferase [Cryomorphaceae bacterium]|jgi:glutathione S-transferase
MILYGSYTSPYARHCRIALMESSLEWQFEDTDYAASSAGSPSQRVPFLKDGELRLTDSTSILMHVRSQDQKPFIENVVQMELYTMANTAMDAAINLFLLERDGVTPETTPYLARQQNRIETLLNTLEQSPCLAIETLAGNYSDDVIRLACFLDWAQFRRRIDLTGHNKLLEFLAVMKTWDTFNATAPS